ncbi:unnamed protein product [Durusdinium trenchii]|uniref:Uncharacterized protein n=1 Tax=Durusdinium trenchii TaxID=1381693 RepID=A0ABP0JGA7_9DINO
MRASEEEDDGPSGLRQVHCTCGVVCSRAVKAAMREVERAADRAEKTQLAQISERLLENTQVRRFLTAFEEQDWPDLLPCVASIGIQALSMHYGRAAQLSLSSLRTLAKWIERHRAWPSSLEILSRSGSPASARRQPTRAPSVMPDGLDDSAPPSARREVNLATPPTSCTVLKPALTGIRARAQIRGRSPPPQSAPWSPRSSPRASPAVATLPWPSRRDEAFQNTRCLQCETEHLPDSVFCRICGSHRDGPQSSRQDRAPMQDEWYQTLMSRLRRLGDQASPRERQAGEPVTFAQSARPMRSASREALSVKLRELGLERPDVPAIPFREPGFGASVLLNDLPDRALRRDGHSAAMANPRREELLF